LRGLEPGIIADFTGRIAEKFENRLLGPTNQIDPMISENSVQVFRSKASQISNSNWGRVYTKPAPALKAGGDAIFYFLDGTTRACGEYCVAAVVGEVLPRIQFGWAAVTFAFSSVSNWRWI